MKSNSKKQTRIPTKKREGKQPALFILKSHDPKKDEVLSPTSHLTKGRPFTIKL